MVVLWKKLRNSGMNADIIKEYILSVILKRYFFKGCEASPAKSRVRFDVFAIRMGYGREVRIYEVKSSRQDFLSDKKWKKYLPYCTHFYFVAPEGAIKIEELPKKVGLIEITTDGKNNLSHKFKRNCKRIRNKVDEKHYIRFLEGILGRYVENLE